MGDAFGRLLDALATRGLPVRRLGPDKARAGCPAHADRRPSLAVDRGGDNVLVHCFAGCATRRVLDVLGLHWTDLRNGPLSAPSSTGEVTVVATYEYCDLSGERYARKLRLGPVKSFRWERANETGWRRGLRGLKPQPYALERAVDARRILVAEGEKAADFLTGLGFVAIAPLAGANVWTAAWTELLWRAGATDVVVLADADAPGRQHAARVAATCHTWRPPLAELERRVRGKTDAQHEAEKIRLAIREGTFRRRADIVAEAAATSAPSTPGAITLADFGRTFLERAGKGATVNNRICLRRLGRYALPDGSTLADKALAAITEDDVEAFFVGLRREGRAVSTTNKYVQLVRALFRWAVKKGYLARNPVADSDVITRAKMTQRHRRLTPDVVDAATGALILAGEERALLDAAGPHLQRLVIAALESCLRLGELPRVEWRDVDLAGRRLTVRAETAKTKTQRIMPVSARLAAVLEMAHASLIAALPPFPTAREQREHVAACFVFGDETGGRVKVVRKAWDTAVLKAHGHRPVWVRSNTLAPESRAALRSVDLHFHDLRHEAGSRLQEAGWPLHHVQHMLGHQSLEQTTTYLNVTLVGLEESMQKFDESVARCKPVAKETGVERTPVRNAPAEQARQHQLN